LEAEASRPAVNPRKSCCLTTAILAAIAGFIVVHRTILPALFAARFVGGKCGSANDGRQERQENFTVCFHPGASVKEAGSGRQHIRARSD